MYDSIDITNNKNLYNFDKLNKLISHKELLYNSIVIYYILYNKFINNSSNNTDVLKDKEDNMEDNINNLVINNNVYNRYESDYKTAYEVILKKIDDLENKIEGKNTNNEYDKIKLELEKTRKNLEEKENEIINKDDNNISILNNHITEYNNILKKKGELESHIEYLNNIISNNNTNNNKEIVFKYKKDIDTLKTELLLSTNRITELNTLLKDYILNNNKNIDNIKILEKQIETTEIYKTENNKKIINLELLLEECRNEKSESYKKATDEERGKMENQYKDSINKLNTSIESVKNEMKQLNENKKTLSDDESIINENKIEADLNIKIMELRKEMENLTLEKTKLINLIKNEEIKTQTYAKKDEELNIQINNLNSEIKLLGEKKINLEESVKKLGTEHKSLLVNSNEKKFMNDLDKNKTELENMHLEILNKYQQQKIESDIDLKLKEKAEHEQKLKYLIDKFDIDKTELGKHLTTLINTNEGNNKIIENINTNIRKINSSVTNEEKEGIRLINNNLHKTLEENKIVFNELKSKTDKFLENKIDNANKIELWKTFFNILHINTGISLLNNVVNNNNSIETNCKTDLTNMDNVKNL